ncbi:MAG: hypothetical protein DRI90_17080 [Deltaproteobacteria bacterium]|nr:MAG: hypothetical protein DRI90_17080 [Deltaproteobacteria bacterium]
MSCQGSNGSRCFYDPNQCTCFGGGNTVWNCATCPGTEPSGSCTDPGMHCAYGATECRCQQGNWVCA